MRRKKPQGVPPDSEKGAPRPTEERYPSFARAVRERGGLRKASFAVPERDAEHVQAAKRRFGPLAVARFVAAVLKAVVRLCHGADHK